MDRSQTALYFKHGIGNLVMLTPAMRALASMDPTGKIDVVLDAFWQDWRRQAFDDFFAADVPFIGRVINYPKENVGKYARWFYTAQGESSQALDLFKARRKDATAQIAPDWLATRRHEVLYCMDEVYKMGYRGPVPDQYFPTADMPDREIHGPLVVLCNGTYDRRMIGAKTWPHFGQLASVLLMLGHTVAKIGYGEELRGVPCSDGWDYVGKLSITQTAAVIKRAALFITTDTACMHIGDALGVRMLALFGGSLVSKNGPLSPRATVVRADLPCQPCQRTAMFYNCGHFDCMTTLTVGKVMKHAEHVLRRI